MGEMERRSKRRMLRGKLETALLAGVAIAGVGLLSVAAPNMVQLLKRADPEWLIKRDPKQRIQEAASRLKKKGLVIWEKDGAKMRLRITDKGRAVLARATTFDIARKRPRKWDGKWRIIIFDIPEKKRALRLKIRTAVMSFGFMRLQDSVWVYPYDCEELIALLKAELKIGKDLLYIIADAIEYDIPLKTAFALA